MDDYEILKVKLVSLGVIECNDYLEKYIRLILENKNTQKEKFKTQTHHIVPRCFYKIKNITIDNSCGNLVNLTYKDHMLAHYYLSFCSVDAEFKRANIVSIKYILNNSHLESNIFDDGWRKENLPRYLELLEYDCKILSDKAKQRVGEKNSFYGHKHTDETKKKISEKKKEQSKDSEYLKKLSDSHKGLKQTKETRDKRRMTLKKAHSDPNKYVDTKKKISQTKRLNNSGNNRKNKGLLLFPDGVKKFIPLSEIINYLKQGCVVKLIYCIDTDEYFYSEINVKAHFNTIVNVHFVKDNFKLSDKCKVKCHFRKVYLTYDDYINIEVNKEGW